MDAPSKFFFGLENRNGQRKIIHCLRSNDGRPLRSGGTPHFFTENFFKTEWMEVPEKESDLPQSWESAHAPLLADLTLEKHHMAIMSQANDGIPVELHKTFWTLMEVFRESFQSRLLPLSCRRALVILLPKKRDLQDLKNWRQVSLPPP